MPSSVENEITGDWNNLKGTEYHLVYALWLLLYRKVASVAFYSGNDLLARPVVPPLLHGSQTLVALQVQLNFEEDEWIHRVSGHSDLCSSRIKLEAILTLRRNVPPSFRKGKR